MELNAKYSFTKKQLETLSDCILLKMQILRGNIGISSELDKVIKIDLKNLQELNTIICNELERIGNA